MLTLLLCSSLWQFEAPQATDEAALATPHANGLALTPAQPASPSLRDHISGQLSEAWLAAANAANPVGSSLLAGGCASCCVCGAEGSGAVASELLKLKALNSVDSC